MAKQVNETDETKTPDAANSYERSRPKEQSPAGKLDQENPPELKRQDIQEDQQQAPNEPPPTWNHHPREASKKP